MQKELIDTQWDVNSKGKPWKLSRVRELIDTQWDVNNVRISCNQSEAIELIDTQWDVNLGVFDSDGHYEE